MDYKTMRNQIEDMVSDNHKDFVKAVISMEKGINDESALDKVYHNCSAYGEKGDIPKDFKQGDFVKLFAQIRTSVDDNGKEHTNIRILSSKLLKAKEQMKRQDEKKESVLGAIKKYQAEDKEKPKEKKEISKGAER